MSHKSFRHALFSVRTFCSSAVNGAFSFFLFFGLVFPRDVSEMCCFIVKSTGTGEHINFETFQMMETLTCTWEKNQSGNVKFHFVIIKSAFGNCQSEQNKK